MLWDKAVNPDSSLPPQEVAPPPAPPPPEKKGLSKGCIAAIVASVLMLAAILALGLLGVFGGRILIKNARMLQAKAVMKGLEIAIKGYKTEYLHLPFATPSEPPSDNRPYDTNAGEGRALLDILLDTPPSDRNPRQIHFWEPPNSKPGGAGFSAASGLVDPWGRQPYRIVLDYSKDGFIDNPEGGSPIESDVILYSAGPDGDFATWKDNVCSWK
jgi:hypothetical protein